MAQQYFGTGGRKTAIARVRILQGSGKFIINGKEIDKFFNYDNLIELAKSPLELTENENSFDVYVNVKGGGFTGQAGAIRHGLSRALCEYDEQLRPVLKRAGFLTRDARKKERHKYGKKKARKSPQFSKR